MAARTVKVLCVHGVGHQEADVAWQEDWRREIAGGLASWSPGVAAELEFVAYDHLFDAADLDPATVAEAILRLTASGFMHGVADLFRRRRGLAEVSERVRWTAGMVAQWAADSKLRAAARKAVGAALGSFAPDAICAHSLGSLISYDLFAREPELLRGRTFVTLGSQIGNPFVRSTLGGRLVPLALARRWFHLYNEEDDVFTAPLRIPAENFEQVDTPFDLPGVGDHDAAAYLSHENASARVWRDLALGREPSRAIARGRSAFTRATARPKRRAVLVGINDYPDPEQRLEGCVNDVFRMSEVLQETGFDPKDIRVVLNERATAQGIRERLDWLLDGARAGDVRFFFYSGHGAQIPGYGAEGEVDHVDECLVPHDFDWSQGRAVTDDQFVGLYSQLPYDTHFVGVLDCCHSGGMTRAGLPRARGLSPPDDVRHRSLRWDPERQMWVPRGLKLSSRKLLRRPGDREDWLGRDGATQRLGRAVSLWSDERQFRRARADFGHYGPYTPVLLQACREEEYAYEYRHGVTAFGAFTYALTTVFRQLAGAGKPVTFETVVATAGKRLAELRYDQHPAVVGPKVKVTAPIPFLAGR